MIFERFFRTKKTKIHYDDLIGHIMERMVAVPGGSFLMGSNEDEKDEHPVHNVLLDPFYIGKYTVTQYQWSELMETTPWKGLKFVKEGINYPAVNISWYEAKEFLSKLSELSNREFRLPTEAEWEYACRAGTHTKFAHGNLKLNLAHYAWYYENAFKKEEMYPHEVGTRKPNKWGIHDMMGNIYEWCGDWYSKHYYAKSPVLNPPGPMYGTNRIVRGGDWAHTDYFLRASSRNDYSPHHKDNNLGFRIIMAAKDLPCKNKTER